MVSGACGSLPYLRLQRLTPLHLAVDVGTLCSLHAVVADRDSDAPLAVFAAETLAVLRNLRACSGTVRA